MKSWTYSLSILCLLTACAPQTPLYVKTFSAEEQTKLAQQFLAGTGVWYYQGSTASQNLIQAGLQHNPNSAELWRELGAPHVKRGFAEQTWLYYGKVVELDARGWQGWRGYLMLYFYRDYENALKDFDATDTLTPNFVDHPQSTSVDFMRGICYLQLGNYDKALSYLKAHIESEIKVVGEAYIDSKTFLYQGIALYKKGLHEEALAALRRGLHNADGRNADLWYWVAKIALEQGRTAEAAEAIENAEAQFRQGYYNHRDYVEEFYQTYPADISALRKQISD